MVLPELGSLPFLLWVVEIGSITPEATRTEQGEHVSNAFDL